MTDHRLLLSACILPMLLAAAPAVAQTAPAEAVDDGGLDTIVVTAQRREEKLQDIPVAVSAFGERAIEQFHLNDPIATSKFVPGMISQHNAGLGSANAYYLRGLGNSQSTATFDAPVTTYVNDIYVARQNANNYAFFDTERVEVLRGPQGTLFGRNTTGGAINVILRKPADKFGFSAETTAGSWDRFTGKATVDAPLSDKVLSKISAFYIYDGGFLKNTTNNEYLNGERNWGVRGDLRLLASSTVTVDLGAEYTRNSGTYMGMRAVAGTSPYIINGTTVPVFYENTAGLPKGSCTQDNVSSLLSTGKGLCNLTMVTALNAKVAWDAGIGTVEWISGFRHMNQGYINQYDQNVNKYAGFILTDNGTNDEWSQELKFNGKLGDRINLTTGLFYLEEVTNDRQTTFSGGTTSFVAAQDAYYRFKAKTAAAYGQADIKLADPLTLTVGGRLTWEKKYLHFPKSTAYPTLSFDDNAVLSLGLPLTQSITKFTPRVALNYKVAPDVMFFASATNGFKSGGWNGTAAAPANAVTFKPENTWSYEAGMKADFLDHKLRINVTGYVARTTDLQATAGVVNPVTKLIASLPFNAGTQVVKGVEIETQARIGELTLFANPSFMDAKYTYISPLTTALTTSLSPVRTPKFQISSGALWEHEVPGLGMVGATAAWRHNSSYWIAVLNTTHTQTENFVDLGVSLKPDDHITVSFDVSNVTDQKTVTANFLSLFPGDPRRYTARLKYKM
jgi:iron complex outermembrane receptor protein